MPAIRTTSDTDSLWLDEAVAGGGEPEERRYPALAGDLTVDVAVLGGGIAGLSTALLLKRSGARVAVLEAARIGSGVTGCTTAKVSALQATVYSTITGRHDAAAARVYADASRQGVEQVAAWVAELGIDCQAERRPAFTYAANSSERESVEREFEAAQAAGLDVQFVEELDLPFPTSGAVRLDDQLQLHPVRYVRGLAAAVDGDGSQVFEHTRALKVREGSPVQVQTSSGVVTADHVVVATHYPILDRGLYFARLDPKRSYCVAARLASGRPAQGMSISAGSNSRSVRSFGDLLIVGGEGHSAGSTDADPDRFERLAAFARAHWDVDTITHRWSAQDPVPYDHLPFVGHYRPGSSRLWVTTGFMKWGMSGATFAATILADEIGGQPHRWSPTFDPKRISVRSVPTSPGSGRSTAPTWWSIASVRPGLAPSPRSRPVRRGSSQRVRSAWVCSGTTPVSCTAFSVRCTRMGCLLRFNSAERSWDCPCHGSRFGVDGDVLEGPAVSPLEPRDVTE